MSNDEGETWSVSEKPQKKSGPHFVRTKTQKNQRKNQRKNQKKKTKRKKSKRKKSKTAKAKKPNRQI